MGEPEITVRSERHFQGKRVGVRVEHVRLSNGVESVREIIDHPNAVVLVAVDDERNVLFVRQYRKAPEVELLELPAGVIDPGETPNQAAQRELQEETGYAAGRMIELGAFFSAPGILTEKLHSYLALDLRDDRLAADDDELIEVERMPYEEAVRVAQQGGFQDAKTLASLLLAAPHLSEA